MLVVELMAAQLGAAQHDSGRTCVGARRRWRLLGTTALVAVALAAWIPGAALADGGAGGGVLGGAGGDSTNPIGLPGGGGGSGGGGGGVSLSNGLGGPGGAGSASGVNTGAGGDGGGGGNFGLVTLQSHIVVGISGTAPGAASSGSAALQVGGSGGGGGEGGGGALLTGGAITLSSNSTLIAGATGGGGNGGVSSNLQGGAGGSGGAGGIGVARTGGGGFINNLGATIQGGSGGAGGNGGSSLGGTLGGSGGDGGDGGIGMLLTNGGGVANFGTIAGGVGGAGGIAGSGLLLLPGHHGIAGAGGVGIVGANVSVVNAGAISGGAGANAVTFTGGANVFELQGNSFLVTGNVVDQTNNGTFRLGGATDNSFAVSNIGPAAQYRGFSSFQKVGTSTWTLTGSTAAVTPWTVSQGKLSVSSDSNLGGASGGLTFNAGTLQFGASFNLASTRAITLNNSVSGTIDTNGFSTTISQGIVGGGSLTKIGSGTLTLSGNNGYIGGTHVNGGTLIVDGTIIDTTVNAGATLGGNGIVGNTFINGGTLSPGNSIGTLTVQGSLVFTAASIYMVEISPSNADRVNVSGTATLGGATVNASFAAGTYVARQYTIVNAAGGVSGTFGSLAPVNLPTNFVSGLSYDANHAYLNLTLDYGAVAGLNANQKNVGNALSNFFNTTGGIPIAFGALTPAGLTQVSGETATGSQQTTFNAMSQFIGVLLDPFVGGRGDPPAPSPGATSFAEEGDGASAYASVRRKRTAVEREAYAAMYRKASLRDNYDPRWSVWAAGFGGSQSTDGNASLGSNDTTSRVFGMAVGADYIFSPRTIAGFALSGGGTSFSVANGGSGRSDLFQAGAFVRHRVGAAYLSAALAYGWQDITTDRTVTIAGIDRLRAQFNANALSGRLEGGYRFVAPWMGVGFTPYAAAQFTTFDLPAYAEQVLSGANTFALAYAAKSVTATRSELGFRADKSFAMQDAILTLRGRAAWAHDYNRDRNVGATFQTLPGASFVVNGAAQASDSALATASAELKWRNGWSAAATFEGEFSDVTRSYAGKGVVRHAW